jgi:hypothetical protein
MWGMPEVRDLFERQEVAAIVDAVESPIRMYVIVDGGTMMGKSVATRMAMAKLSSSRVVLLYDATTLEEEAKTSSIQVIEELLGLHGVETNRKLCTSQVLGVWNIPEDSPEPVVVIDSAERLPSATLRSLLHLAKEFADNALARFIFVFAPSDKFMMVLDQGALSGTNIIEVNDIPEPQAAF